MAESIVSPSIAPAPKVAKVATSTVWQSLAQCSAKNYPILFLDSADTLASAYTGPKQLVNALERVGAAYGLRPEFKRILKDAQNGLAVSKCFDNEAFLIAERVAKQAEKPTAKKVAKPVPGAAPVSGAAPVAETAMGTALTITDATVEAFIAAIDAGMLSNAQISALRVALDAKAAEPAPF